MRSRKKPISENDFRDSLVLQIIHSYGQAKSTCKLPGRPSCSECRVRHINHEDTVYSDIKAVEYVKAIMLTDEQINHPERIIVMLNDL